MDPVDAKDVEQSSKFDIAYYTDYVFQNALNGTPSPNSPTDSLSKTFENAMRTGYLMFDPGCEVKGIVKALAMGVAFADLTQK